MFPASPLDNRIQICLRRRFGSRWWRDFSSVLLLLILGFLSLFHVPYIAMRLLKYRDRLDAPDQMLYM